MTVPRLRVIAPTAVGAIALALSLAACQSERLPKRSTGSPSVTASASATREDRAQQLAKLVSDTHLEEERKKLIFDGAASGRAEFVVPGQGGLHIVVACSGNGSFRVRDAAGKPLFGRDDCEEEGAVIVDVPSGRHTGGTLTMDAPPNVTWALSVWPPAR